ncbi:MAG: carbohydrate binding family 9 domain-containing protein [bacterium]
MRSRSARPPGRRPGAALALLFLLLPAAAGGQSEELLQGSRDPHDYRVRALRAQRAPVLDGRLDEAAWQRAEPATGFTQRNLVEGAPASERTEIRTIVTEGVFYIGARMFDSRPEELVVTAMRRASRLHDDDYLGIVLDTFHDHRNAFEFQVNPAGARWDAYVTDEGRDVNSDFNVVWDAATRADDEGWTAEMAIPLSQLRFSGAGGPQRWRINFRRSIRRKNEEVFWVPVLRDYGMHGFNRVSNAGLLTGLDDLPVGVDVNLQFSDYSSFRGQYANVYDPVVGGDPSLLTSEYRCDPSATGRTLLLKFTFLFLW